MQTQAPGGRYAPHQSVLYANGIHARNASAHTVRESLGRPCGRACECAQTLLYIDRHYGSDDLPPAVYGTLAARKLGVRRPESTFAMPDHYVATGGNSLKDIADDERREFVAGLQEQTRRHGLGQR
jgi:homoaconitase/3-isopropylmalate dehydratase large subunit